MELSKTSTFNVLRQFVDSVASKAHVPWTLDVRPSQSDTAGQDNGKAGYCRSNFARPLPAYRIRRTRR